MEDGRREKDREWRERERKMKDGGRGKEGRMEGGRRIEDGGRGKEGFKIDILK